MAGSLNRVQLIGRVGKDPEIRNTQSGDSIANFTLATTDSWKDKSGEKKERTEWHRIACFNSGLVKVIQDYVKKGTLLYVAGALQTRKWTDKDGQDRYTTEIVLGKFGGELILLGGKGGAGGESRGDEKRASSASQSSNAGGWSGSFEDDIPF